MKIPIYERRVERSAEGSLDYSLRGERSSPLAIPSGAAEFQGLQEAAERVTGIGARLKEAERVEAISRAKVSAHEGLAKIRQEIAEDPALNDAAPEEYERRYTERANELKGTLSGGIKDTTVRSLFSAQFDESALNGRVHVRALGRERMISRGRASTDQQLDSLVNSFVKTGDVKLLAEGNAIIEAKRAAGFFSPVEAEQLTQRFAKASTVSFWERRIMDAPRLAYEMLQGGAHSTEGLDEGNRTRLIQTAKEAHERATKTESMGAAYSDLVARNGSNYERSLVEVNNPKNWAKWGLDFDTAGRVNDRMRTLLSERESMERIGQQNLKERQDKAEIDVWTRYFNGEMKAGELDQLHRGRSIGTSTYTQIRRHMADVGAERDNPVVAGELAEAIERGEDVTGRLTEALEAGNLKPTTYVQMKKSLSDSQYKEGLGYLSNALKPTPADQWSPDKNIRYAEAMDAFNNRIRSGEKPIEVARDLVDSYVGSQRRTVNGLRLPRFMPPGASDKRSAQDLDKARATTLEAFASGRITENEYKDEVRQIDALQKLSGRLTQQEQVAKDVSDRASKAIRAMD